MYVYIYIAAGALNLNDLNDFFFNEKMCVLVKQKITQQVGGH